MLNGTTRLRVLTWLLRIAGVSTALAYLAILLPSDWMASTHERLGLGVFPRAPVVDYLARSIAALYGFHGLLLLLLSTDPSRFQPILSFIAFLNIAQGVMLVAIDLHAGMPAWWTLSEGPLVIVFGVAVAMLNR